MTIVYFPACVPVTGGWVELWLHAGKKISIPATKQNMKIPRIRRRRRLPPTPSSANPGSVNHTAKKRGENNSAAGVTIGRAVVTMFNETVAPLVLCNVVELAGAKLQVVALGRFEHD